MASDDPLNIPTIPSEEKLNWTWKGSKDWVKKATISQNQLYVANAGRMYDAAENYDYIETKILISAFGSPTSTNRSMGTRLNHCYSRPERKIATKMRKKIQKKAGTECVKLNSVFVMSYLKEGKETMVPVFYFEAYDNSRKYIDLQARIYVDWNNFLKTNQIDPSLCCYPINGTYGQTQISQNPTFDESVQLQLQVDESPSCEYLKTAGRWAQTALTYASYILMASSMVATVSGAQCIARFSKLKSWSDKMKLIQPYINKAQKFTQYANAATAIASSILNIHDKITHEEEEILADITLIVSSVLSILSDPINRAIIKGGLEGQDLATAKFSDLSSISRIFLQLFCLARYATSVISVFTIIITMLKKDECTGSDYFNLASSLFTCYGTVTSPRTAKKIFEQVQNECKFEEFNETKRQIEASKNANKSDGVAETAVIVGAAAAVGAGATAKISDVNQSDPKGPNEINYCINKNSASNDCAVSTAVGGGIGSGSGSGNPNDPQKPPSGGDHQNEATKTYKNYETSNKAGLRGDPPATDAEKTELIKKRDELAKNIIKDENDEAGKAAKEYYEKNILLVFKGSENEHVMNQQLVRMMEAATDIREMFCEIALTETTFDIKNGVLLINGQLNIDGAAFAVATNNLNDGQKKSDIGQRLLDKIAAEAAGQKYIDPKNALKSDREKIMAETKNYDENKEIIAAKFEEDKSKLTEKRNTEREELIEKQKAARDGFLNSKKKNEMSKEEVKEKLDKIDRNAAELLKKFDIDTENRMHALKVDPFLAFKQEYRIVFEPHINEFEQNLANQGLLDFEIGGKKVFKDLNGSDYFRLIQQFGKDNISKDNGDSMKAAMIMAEKVGFNTPEGIAACHQQVLNEMFSHIGTNPQGPQRDIRQQFLNRFNDPNDSLSTELATNFSNGLNETEKYLIEKHPGGSGTGLKHRYDLDNEDPRTVAAVAYVHATEGGKRLTRREWDQETKIEKTKIYISNGTEKTGQLRLSQDGTKWVLMAPEDEN